MNDRPSFVPTRQASKPRAADLLSAAGAGIAFAVVVSCGIIGQRVWGTTPTRAFLADAATTIAALVLSRRALVRPPNREGGGAWGGLAERLLQALGACLGVLAMHGILSSVAPPWIVERPAQLVNDLVAVFGVLAFVWSTSESAIFPRNAHARRRILPAPHLALGALAIVLVYELTATVWHFDATHAADGPRAAWSIQRFVGTEVTTSGLGILVFRALLV